MAKEHNEVKPEVAPESTPAEVKPDEDSVHRIQAEQSAHAKAYEKRR